MKYSCKETNNRLGIILPIPYIMTEIYVILDENNRLWHAPKSVADGSIESFGLVQFSYEGENQVTFIKALKGYNAQVRKFRDLEEISNSIIPTDEIGGVDFNYLSIIDWQGGPLYICGYLLSDYDFSYNRGLFSRQYDNILKKRYFLTDYSNKSYRELTGDFIVDSKPKCKKINEDSLK